MPKDDDKTPAKAGTKSPAPTERGWGSFWNLRDEIDDLFDDFMSGGPMAAFQRRGFGRPMAAMASGTILPKLDMVETEDEIKLTAELPGLEEKDVDVQVTDHMLTMSGEKREEREEGDKDSNYHLSERRFGSFRRSIQLPDGVDHDKIKAAFRNGVLTVHIPKAAQAKKPARKIEVKAAG